MINLNVLNRLGAHHLTGTTRFQRSYGLKKIIVHKQYHGRHLRNDIAVLQLGKSIDDSLRVNVVCLPKAGNRVKPGKKYYIRGNQFFDVNGTYIYICSSVKIKAKIFKQIMVLNAIIFVKQKVKIYPP